MKILPYLVLCLLPIESFAQDSTMVTTFGNKVKPVLPEVRPNLKNCVTMQTDVQATSHLDFRHGHFVGTPSGEWLSARCPEGSVAHGLRAAIVSSAIFSKSYFKWNYYCCSLETMYPNKAS